MASEGAVTVVGFKLFHNAEQMDKNMSWYVQKVESMSTLFRKLQVLPLHLANFVTVIELPTLTSAFSNHM